MAINKPVQVVNVSQLLDFLHSGVGLDYKFQADCGGGNDEVSLRLYLDDKEKCLHVYMDQRHPKDGLGD